MKPLITTIQFLLVIIFSFLGYTFAQQMPLAEAKIVVNSFSTQQDSLISVGVLVTLKDVWHIYWRNPGDSGIATEIEFILPGGISASEIKFPIPEVIAADEIVNYGYKHQVLFISDLKIPKDLKSREINISAKITSLICKDICKAFDTTITIKIDLSKNYLAETALSKLFDSTKKLIPQNNRNLKVNAFSKSDLVILKISDDEIINSHRVQFLSYDAGVFRNLVSQSITRNRNNIEFLLEPDPFRIKNPDYINGILILENDDKSTISIQAFEISLPIMK
jgi:thiol:disulfide interchange protein DsbD